MVDSVNTDFNAAESAGEFSASRGAGPEFSRSWHFDALSDDGREALVINFYDNYLLSPRTLRNARQTGFRKIPAVTFTYAVDGEIILRAINEYREDQLSSRPDGTLCTIARSSFSKTSAAYGTGFVVTVELLTARNCQILAELEWVSIESPAPPGEVAGGVEVVASRSDVSGRIELLGKRGTSRKMFHFRGTGYHDHTRVPDCTESLAVSNLSGRAHFVDSTAIFRCCQAAEGGDLESQIMLVNSGGRSTSDAAAECQNIRRDRYGLAYPRRIVLTAPDNVKLRIKPLKTVESGFFLKVMAAETTLVLRDGRARKTTGLVEFGSPRRLRSAMLKWLSGLRVGKNGRAAYF